MAFLALVVVPEDVSLDGVEARLLELQQPVAPQRLRAARIVERRAENKRVAVIDGEATRVVADEVRVLEKLLVLHERQGAEQEQTASAERSRQRRYESGLEKTSSRWFHSDGSLR